MGIVSELLKQDTVKSDNLRKYKVPNKQLIEIFTDIEELLARTAYSRIVGVHAGESLTFLAKTDMLYKATPTGCETLEGTLPIRVGFLYSPIHQMLDPQNASTITITEHAVIIESEDVQFYLNSEEYIDVEQGVPAKTNDPVTIQTAPILSAIKNVSYLAPITRSFGLPTVYTFAEGKLSMRLPNCIADFVTSEDLNFAIPTGQGKFFSTFLSPVSQVQVSRSGNWVAFKKPCATLYVVYEGKNITQMSTYKQRAEKVCTVDLSRIHATLKNLVKFQAKSKINVSAGLDGVSCSLTESRLQTTFGIQPSKQLITFDIYADMFLSIVNALGTHMTVYSSTNYIILENERGLVCITV